MDKQHGYSSKTRQDKNLLRPPRLKQGLQEILPRLAKAKVFSTLDAKDGFYQIGLDDESSMKTAFWTPLGGISLAPEEFECKLYEKLDDLPGVVVLRNDVLVMGYGETREEAIEDHDSNLIKLLQRARETNLKLNKSKIKLRQPEVKFMRHVITNQGGPDPDKVQAVDEVPRPTCKKELATLLGFVNYLSKFLPRLAEVTT